MLSTIGIANIIASDTLVTSDNSCMVCAMVQVCGNRSLTEWVSQGHDEGTTLHAVPSDDILIAMGRDLLNINHDTM